MSRPRRNVQRTMTNTGDLKVIKEDPEEDYGTIIKYREQKQRKVEALNTYKAQEHLWNTNNNGADSEPNLEDLIIQQDNEAFNQMDAHYQNQIDQMREDR